MIAVSSGLRQYAALFARVVIGAIFIAYGWQKVFVRGIDSVAAGFASSGVPMPTTSAWVAGLGELVGGVLLVVGFAIPITSVVLVGIMIGAIFSVGLSKGFFDGVTLPLSLAAGLIGIVAIAAPSSLSLDALIARRSAGID